MKPLQRSLLLVDDDQLVAEAISLTIPDHWKFQHLTDLDQNPSHIDLALVDMHLSANKNLSEGLRIVRRLRQLFPALEIVAISGDLDLPLMESCLEEGASRFLAKPLGSEEVLLTLEKTEALILLREAQSRPHNQAHRWIGHSPFNEKLHRQIASLKGEAGPLLIQGESGTGKEVVAHLLHSQEPPRPFVAINSAAIPSELFESELFGHLKGAFTGAEQNKIGLIEAAHGGDLFLDEIEALPENLQAKLLRFLESGEIRPVGAKNSKYLRVRVIAASNRDLREMSTTNEFREDLLWRLSGQQIHLPPLRERKEDIIELSYYFLSQERPRRNKSFSKQSLQLLQDYHWPGNTRELKRLCEQASLISPLPIIRAEDLSPLLFPSKTLGAQQQVSGDLIDNLDLDRGLQPLLADFEAHILKKALKSEKDMDEIAKLLKISRSSLYKKIKDHQLSPRS